MTEFHPYVGQTAVLSTMHGKQQVIAPVLQNLLGVSLIVAADVDTDVLGTFSGEMERSHSMIDTLRLKVEMGRKIKHHPLGIGTEASFGPDPRMPLLPLHLEMLMWCDWERGIEVVEQIQTNETNYEHLRVKKSIDFDVEVQSFLQRVQFPSHKLMVMTNADPKRSNIFKGIADLEELREAVNHCAQRSFDGMAMIQTDMRAMMNPTRMNIIEKGTVQLVNRLLQRCEQCESPGWGLIELVRGLPCDWCGRPTNQVWAELHGCCKCNYRIKTVRQDGLQTASPAYCEWCNP